MLNIYLLRYTCDMVWKMQNDGDGCSLPPFLSEPEGLYVHVVLLNIRPRLSPRPSWRSLATKGEFSRA